MKTRRPLPTTLLLVGILCAILGTTQGACNRLTPQAVDTLFNITDRTKYSYDLNQPVEKFFLPYKLAEVSGLQHDGNNHILCVDDESGRVFFFDTEVNRVVRDIQFHAPRDFEGVTLVDSTIVVLESDGDLHTFQWTNEKESKSRKQETALSRDHDTEGLAYDRATGRLIIVAKEDGTKELPGFGLYAWSLADSSLSKERIADLSAPRLETFFESHRKFDYETERIKFKPSGVAVHPITGTYYVIASIGKLMLEVSTGGQILASYRIPPVHLGQPEGITFAPNGDLYLSSEGEGDRGYILLYEMTTK